MLAGPAITFQTLPCLRSMVTLAICAVWTLATATAYWPVSARSCESMSMA